MQYLDLAFADAAANLACDEALLNHCEAADAGEVLRLWEAMAPFVVLGYSNRAALEIDTVACEREGVPVLRRFSGGGAVLQAPGCLNYTLVLRNQPGSAGCSITETFTTVLSRHCDLFARLIDDPVEIQGTSDLTAGGKKFSGNSQHRKSRYTLVHGTILLRLDLTLMTKLLRMPSRQPAYRRSAPHADFVKNLNLDPEVVREGIKQQWNARERFSTLDVSDIDELVRDRYSKPGWNYKFC